MTDVLSLSVAVAGLAVAAGAVYGIYVQRGQLRLAEEQLAVAKTQIESDEQKIAALGSLVEVLKGMVEYHAQEIATLEKIVERLDKSADLKERALAVAQQDVQLRAAELAWAQMNPVDKVAIHLQDLGERAKNKIARGIRRLFGGE